MTLPLRRKRLITALNSPRATITDRLAHLAWSAVLGLVGVSLLSVSAFAGGAQDASASKLQWHARGWRAPETAPAPTQQPLQAAREPARLTFREGRSPSTSSTAAETIAEPLPLARETGKPSRLSTRTTSRGKTRGVVQVSGDPSDAFKDPFGDDA